MITNAWYVAGFSPDFVRGRLHAPVVAGLPLVLWRTVDGDVVAYDGRCRHKRFPLLRSGGDLRCAYHGICYDQPGPCSPGSAPSTVLPRRPVTEKDGLVWVWPGAPGRAQRVAVPDTPEIPGWATVRSEPVEVAASSRLLVENLLDIRRSYPLHVRSLGGGTRIAMRLERRTIGGVETVKTVRRARDQQLPDVMRDWFGYDVVDREHTHHVLNPGLTRIELRVGPAGLGGEREKGYVLHHLHTPVAPGRLRWWWTVSCRSRELADRVADGIAWVIPEYRWAIEAQQSMLAHPERGHEDMPVKTDGAVVLLRRVFEHLERLEDEPDHAELARLRTGVTRC
ncbi:Rieske 2Fe-2S domain-containing protein [Amycolatopsis thermoflava]|uniref:Rieske 2Fe-2S domain-containing protein n=1 Tax=Amycolatopsis thermoflava TaxID=84480 RepID=UPI0038119CB8